MATVVQPRPLSFVVVMLLTYLIPLYAVRNDWMARVEFLLLPELPLSHANFADWAPLRTMRRTPFWPEFDTTPAWMFELAVVQEDTHPQHCARGPISRRS